jgi:hypothetical protein
LRFTRHDPLTRSLPPCLEGLLEGPQLCDVLLMLLQVLGERVRAGSVGDEVDFFGTRRIGRSLKRRSSCFWAWDWPQASLRRLLSRKAPMLC